MKNINQVNGHLFISGTGKSSVLYSILNNFKNKNIITIEKPVEIDISSIKAIDISNKGITCQLH